MMQPTVKTDKYELYLGDCLPIMQQMEAGSVDAVITDPPYNVGLKYENTTNDSRDDYCQWISARFDEMRRLSDIVIITPGIANISLYPRAYWTCGWFKPGSTRRNGTGGFNEWEPIFIYADKLKFQSDAIRLPDCINHDARNDHPCPKPLRLFTWLVKNSTASIVLDPFMGSGTTGVACMQLGRKFIGIEIDPKYFEIARKRIEQAARQEPLFVV